MDPPVRDQDDTHAPDPGEAMTSPACVTPGPPVSIPGFEIVRYVAGGGMGDVYEALQLHPRRRVAIKVMRASLPGAARERFLRESQLATEIEGRGIARVYQTGEWEGRPWFAMEFIEGRDLGEHVDALRPTSREIVETVVKTCDAVARAHQKLIVHRDLKPANVIVDDAGEPHVLDFGIARLLTDRSLTVGFTGTLAYAAPEQIAGQAADTRMDVYALGAILGRLLTGEVPSGPWSEGGRRLDDPDLDAILAMATARLPDDRYGSAAALAADLRRWLDGGSVSAREGGRREALVKWMRRHRRLVAAVAAVLVAASIAAAAILRASAEARRERDRAVASERRALEEARKSKAVVDLFSEVLVGAGGEESGATHDMTLVEALDVINRRIGQELQDEPEVQATLQVMIGRAMTTLAMPDRAHPGLKRALATRLRLHGPDHPGVAEAHAELARGNALRGRDDVEPHLAEALRIRETVLGPMHPDVAATLEQMAERDLEQGRLDVAALRLSRALAIRRLVNDARPLGSALLARASLALRQGDVARADADVTEARALFAEALDVIHPAHAEADTVLGRVRMAQGRTHEAIAAFGAAYGRLRHALGEQHPRVAVAMRDLAEAHLAAGNVDDALWLHEGAVKVGEVMLGSEHPGLLPALDAYAALLEATGRDGEAAARRDQAERIRRAITYAEDP